MTQREEFERWYKHDFHPDKTGPYVKINYGLHGKPQNQHY